MRAGAKQTARAANDRKRPHHAERDVYGETESPHPFWKCTMRNAAYTLTALLFASGLASAQPAKALKQEADRVAVVAKVKPSVVAVFARGGQGGGTGVLINDEGYALTNFHVVQPTGPTMQCGLADGIL